MTALGRGPLTSEAQRVATAIETRAALLAEGMRRDARVLSRFDRRMRVLELLHNDPQVLAEIVLVLAETTPTPERR